ncbi:MAG: PorT family protein [Fibromonadaceae bacterium]|nr:PorT family protein [Fibromonadaceae bacterium]
MNIAKHALALLLACASAATAQDSAKVAPEKIAVYAFGASDAGINKALGSKLLADLVQSGMYAEIQDHHAFQEELAKAGNSGSAAQAAKRRGADIVCAVSIVEVFEEHSITASMQKTQDSQVLKTASLDRSLKSIDDLAAVSRELAVQLLGKKPPPAEAVSAAEPVAAAAVVAVAALPKPPKKTLSVAETLSGTSLSRSCMADFTTLLETGYFDMASFAKELLPTVAKTKLQLKAPFGKPKDSEITSSGLSVGCIKTLPESPAEVQFLLKDIALKMGLDFAIGAAAGAIDSYAEAEDSEAKNDKGTASFGIRIGLNASQLHSTYNGYDYARGTSNKITGVQLGFIHNIALSDWFHVQPGLMYIQKGMDENNEDDMTLHYIEVPLLFSLKIFALRINVGPYYSACLTASGSSNRADYFSWIDYGLSMGFGFDIGKLYIGMFYDHGLIDINDRAYFDSYSRTYGFNLGLNL